MIREAVRPDELVKTEADPVRPKPASRQHPEEYQALFHECVPIHPFLHSLERIKPDVVYIHKAHVGLLHLARAPEPRAGEPLVDPPHGRLPPRR